MPTGRKHNFKSVETHSGLAIFPPFTVDVLEDIKNLNSKFALEYEY